MRIKTPLSTLPAPKKKIPALNPNEEIILQDQGGYKTTSYSGWKVVDCFLTNQRFILYQLRKTIFEVPLASIYDLKTEKHYYVLRKRDAIGIFYRQSANLRNGSIWFIVNNSQIWKNKIMQASLLKIDEKVIKIIFDQLDESSQAILLYLWDKRHARINELADICGGENHMEVLNHIQYTINPIAEKEIGCPLLSFERSRYDPETGEKILFSWWLVGKPEKWNMEKDHLMDIFDEGDYFQIILDVKNVEKSDLKISVNGDELIIESKKTASKWVETFKLPKEVVFENHQVYLKNSLLEIKLQKAK